MNCEIIFKKNKKNCQKFAVKNLLDNPKKVWYAFDGGCVNGQNRSPNKTTL